MKDSDLIIYPSKQDNRVYIGEITGPYQYFTESADTYPHRRPVRWIKNFPRTKFTQGALNVIGAPLSFFQVKNHADEFLLAIAGKGSAQEAMRDEIITYMAEDLNKDTKDSDQKIQSQELGGNGLEKVVYLKIFLLFLIIVAASIWFLDNT
jgi:restriction system protein